MKIAELMTKGAMTCSQTDTLDRAAQIMWEHDCGAVPVVDDYGSTVGIVTDRDICMAAYTQGRPLSEIPISVAASRSVIAASPEDSVESAAQLMQTHQIRRVPILNGQGEPVGILGIGDLARHATGIRKMDGVSADLIARTLAAVSQPRERAIHIEGSVPPGRPASAKSPAGPPSTPSEQGIAYHVKSVDGGWVVVDREGRHLGELQRTQSDAVIHAKELARRIGSAQVIVHRQDGSVASEFFYQRDERSALSSDDSLRTVAASKPARARAAHRPSR